MPKRPPEMIERPVFGVPGSPGLVRMGNINLNDRPILHDKDGSVSTIVSTSYGEPNSPQTVIPMIRRANILDRADLLGNADTGVRMTFPEALKYSQASGEDLGVVKTNPVPADHPDHYKWASDYGQALHLQQQAQIKGISTVPMIDTTREGEWR